MFGKKQIVLEDQTDEALYILMKDGNTSAFNLLYKRYQGKLLYYFYRMLGNDETVAQDFLQEVFFKIIDKPYLFDPKRKFSTWIYTIAHNMCKNEYRGQAVRKIMIKGQNADVYFENETNYSDKGEVIGAIFKELELMDESHRSAFLLKYREGLGVDEIAEILDLPLVLLNRGFFIHGKNCRKYYPANMPKLLKIYFKNKNHVAAKLLF